MRTLIVSGDTELINQAPQLIEFVDAVPKTATGKIERYKLRSPTG